jgi:hypothetical protein
VHLSDFGEYMLRVLKSAGERAVRGRDIDYHSFDSMVNEDSTETIRMIMEGRHAMSIGNQIVRKFESMGKVDNADVIKTKRGAKVVIRPSKESRESK